ncbi:Cellulose synthase-like protein E6 [Nymphaea thermarum]|nr:Cellulose synthase-like protein E6 [Nymphaea thermarum]
MARKEVHLHSSRSGRGRGRGMYRVLAAINLVGMVAVLFYRVTNIPHESLSLKLLWAAMTLSELWLCLVAANRFEEELPGVDAFVCTADPWKEPPLLVIGTVLSLMAYDYPPEKLSVYLSDDGGSDLTLYALLEASAFAKHWLPFCRKFKIEPRSPAAFFSTNPDPPLTSSQECLFDDMANRIEGAVSLGRVPPEIREEHQRLFSDWIPATNSRDHPAILKILISGEDSKAVDVNGWPLPTLVYLAREKRPGYAHNFKAGAMNALVSCHEHECHASYLIGLVVLRVSSEISNAPIILNVDCDMYSNDSQSVRDALCFFMDEKTGRQVAFVQFPQRFNNVTKNDIYDTSILIYNGVNAHGFDRFEGTAYVGSGCFHRREILMGRKYSDDFKGDLNGRIWRKPLESVDVLEERGKFVASCASEENTMWGTEISALWSIPFLYVSISTYVCNLVEVLLLGGTFKFWWNGQRMWMIRRVTSYFFAFLDTMLKLIGMGEMKFTVTSKVVDADATARYENEIMEFGNASPMFIVMTTVAVHNLACLTALVFKVVVSGIKVLDALFFQATLCGFIVLLSLPIYEAAFLRRDKGRSPTSVAFTSVALTLAISLLALR